MVRHASERVNSNRIDKEIPFIPFEFHLENLLPAVYHLDVDTFPEGWHLQGKYFKLTPAEPFPVYKKIYGETIERANRVINTYNNIKTNLGIILYGASGSGKSVLARRISSAALLDLDMHTIIITDRTINYLEGYMSQVKRPCLFLFDEFEKMFNTRDQQDFLLTILDGTYATRHIFVMTANNPTEVSTYFFNRPTRIRYAWEYTGLDIPMIREILTDNLIDQSKSERIVELLRFSKNLSFDVLNTFIHECNLYPNESPEELIKGFNIISGAVDMNANYTLSIIKDGLDLKEYVKEKGLEITLPELDLEVYHNGKVLSFNDLIDAQSTKSSIKIAHVKGRGEITIAEISGAKFVGEDFVFTAKMTLASINSMISVKAPRRGFFDPGNETETLASEEDVAKTKELVLKLQHSPFKFTYKFKERKKGAVKTLSDSSWYNY